MSIYVDNKLLSDNGGKVYLPYGCEYEIHFKNTDHRTCGITKVLIDGENILKKTRLVVLPNEKSVLKGISKEFDASLSKDYAFKFIQKTEKISEFRGDRDEDGLITINFGFEKPDVPLSQTRFEGMDSNGRYSKGLFIGSGPQNSVLRSMQSDSINKSLQPTYIGIQSFSDESDSASEKGITVKGQEIEQSFQRTRLGQLVDFGSMTIELYSKVNSDTPVSEPIHSKGKVQCKTCGTTSPNKFKFCPECSTNLH